MTTSKGPAPGFINEADHEVRISASEQRWIVRLGTRVLADSIRTQMLMETGFEPVIYFPLGDVNMSHLVQTEDRTTCPFKGEAQYFRNAASKDKRPIAWRYPLVFDEVAAIKGHIAFYGNRVDLHQAT